ncbi:MAG: hypothetical protein M0D53_16260 [Flavobacterium sp. JAD_PAG50586_2]|nr:MAG: hypothetical protein M0D53_16260 [Flavobacterium sp. JAD_PAG50586_2]
MRKAILLIVVLLGCQMQAQFKVKVNSKLITEATVLKAEDIKKIEVSFDKPKKLSYYGTGRLYFWVDFIGEKDEIIESYYITKDGSNAVESFLSEVNTFYTLPSDLDKNTWFQDQDIIRGGTGINYKLMYFGKNYGYKTVKFRVCLGFRDKTGYQKYGDLVNLVKTQTYTIDNSTLYTEGQKLKAEEKIAQDAKDAEKAKADEEAKKQADAEAKKGKGKKLIKNVLGW